MQIAALIVRSWSAGTRTAALTFALLALVAVGAAIFYMNEDNGAAERVNAFMEQVATVVGQMVSALIEWARALLAKA